MCKARDIILINQYSHNGVPVKKHSFIVLDDKDGTIRGLPYDFIGIVLSSFKNEEQKARKLSYPGNFPITHTDVDVPTGNNSDGYVKADQLYFFNKSKIDYRVIGEVNKDIFELLLTFIDELSTDIATITSNL